MCHPLIWHPLGRSSKLSRKKATRRQNRVHNIEHHCFVSSMFLSRSGQEVLFSLVRVRTNHGCFCFFLSRLLLSPTHRLYEISSLTTTPLGGYHSTGGSYSTLVKINPSAGAQMNCLVRKPVSIIRSTS